MSNASTAGFRGPAKRAAFGDVTNMAKNAVGAREEAKVVKLQPAVASHHAQPLAVVNKENIPYNSKDSLSRPAQRSSALASKPKAAVEARPTEATKKPVSATALDSGGHLGKADPGVPRQKTTIDSERDPNLAASQASIEGLPLQPRHYKSQPQLKSQQPTLRRTQSKQLERTEVATDRAATANADVGGMPLHNSDRSIGHTAYPALPYSAIDYDPLVEVNHCEAYADLPTKLPEITEEPYNAAVSYRDGQTPGLSEPEEWDEDDYEDYDDQDQAYTTAHSSRSRDLTTGGVTTLLGPRVTARVQRELEEAKLEVQQTRSLDDIEEEMWDVSMVAEYGEEIFEYMRELEVSVLFPPYLHGIC